MKIISALLFIALLLLVFVPTMLLSFFVVPFMLLTKWDGKTTVFGNKKWGRATLHPINPTKGLFGEYIWFVIRNPVNNLCTQTISAHGYGYKLDGDIKIGDKVAGGSYYAYRDVFFEYYLIKPYGKRCIRARIGWKLHNSDSPAAFCLAFNPFMKYSGV